MDSFSDTPEEATCINLKLVHSLGYECQRHYNLCVADEHTLLFCSGNLLHMFDTETKQVRTRLSDSGDCLGFITKNPSDSHIAVGEKGLRPTILIYDWPSFEVVQKLKNGTTKDYVFLTYSPDGRMLCAQGGFPDYSMTLWDWCKGTIIARTSSPFTHRIHFSNYNANYMVSCGEQGLSFWQLTKTYTGTKLLQERGHFNILDECQVLAAYIMPDGKVVSGCTWGNMLVWSEGRVVIEACQRERQACHNGPIINFTYNRTIDELYTVGMDGWIKMWHYGRFTPEPLSDDLTVVIKPVFEIQVCDIRGPSTLSYILKKNNDPNDFTWFAQDKNGGLWQVEMQVSATVRPSIRLYTCHAGPVAAVAASPQSLYFASLGANGVIHFYDFKTGNLLAFREFSIGGTKLFWLAFKMACGNELIAAGFADGTLKLLSLSPDGSCVNIKQESKPHGAAVSAISVDKSHKLLVTGSEDKTVFVYRLQTSGQLVPVGFIQLPCEIRYFSWKPDEANILLICCGDSLSEAMIPEEVTTIISYKITASMTTVAHIQSDDNTLENLLYAVYSEHNSIYLVDSNSLHEYSWETKSIINQVTLDQPISTVSMLDDGKVWFFGLTSGTLRSMVKKGECGWNDLTLHNPTEGPVSDICLSCDLQYLADCGRDGNLFVYSFNTSLSQINGRTTSLILAEVQDKSAEEEDDQENQGVSLEEAKKDAVLREKLAVVMMKKVRVQKQLASLRLRFKEILRRNSKLPESQRLPVTDFHLDKRLQFHIKNLIATEMKLVKQKLSFDVEKSQLRLNKLKNHFIDCLASFYIEISAIRGKKGVATFVHRKMDEEFESGEQFIKVLMKRASEKIHRNSYDLVVKPSPDTAPACAIEVDTEEPYLRSVQDIYSKLNIKTKRALEKHKLMKNKKEDRKKQWQAFLATQPDQDKNLTSDVAAIEHAMRTMGDYKLKCSDDFKLLDQSKNTTLYKLNQLVEAKREIYNMKEEFNRKVYTFREHKVELVRKVEQLETRLLCLHKELPKESRIHPPPPPQLNVAKEYPERQYQISPGREPGIMSPQVQEFDEEFFILFGSRISIPSLYSSDEDLEKYDKENGSLSDNEENINQDEDTLWETEIRILRIARQVFKQNDILEEMEVLITEFDTRLEELSRERLQLSIDIKYLECFVNLLHQELHIIHSYDETEAAILERVNNSLAEKHTKHLKVNILQHKIDARAAELTLVEEKLAAVEKSFTELTAGNRVSRHLTRIFRKKFRPQLLKRENEDEESEEESSTEEDTSDDSDSAVNVGKPSPRIDDNKCPADCDKEIHKETLELRSKRYQLEAKITSEKQAIDLMMKEKERTFKFLKMIEPVLRMNQDQLEKIQKDKQTRLNETEVLVVLSCSQICGQNLLMSRHDLDKLRARVSELQRQTDVQLEKLKKSQRYQQRLTDDYSKIDVKISQLKKDIDKAMICKFGQHVDVEALEEKILEQMIQRTRKALKEEELHTKYERMIKDLKEELLEKTEDLADLMRENTHKLQMLSSLEEEKQKLIALAIRVNKAAAEPNDREAEYTQDVHKLTKILNSLLLQKETIIHEIKVLSLKGRPLPPIVQTVVKEPDTIIAPKCESRDSDDIPTTEEGRMTAAQDLEEDSEFEYIENGTTEQ